MPAEVRVISNSGSRPSSGVKNHSNGGLCLLDYIRFELKKILSNGIASRDAFPEFGAEHCSLSQPIKMAMLTSSFNATPDHCAQQNLINLPPVISGPPELVHVLR
jgi:hypothetical protein